jgi:hypothetical protein
LVGVRPVAVVRDTVRDRHGIMAFLIATAAWVAALTFAFRRPAGE